MSRTIRTLRSQAMRNNPRPATPDITAQLDDEFFEGTRRQAKLLTWARNNRLYSAVAISLMLAVNAGLTFWLGVTPLSITSNSAQFQVEILVACWLNGTLSTLVAILILLRSLDGGSHTVYVLRRFLPFVPFPPEISLTDPSRATTRDWKNSRAAAAPGEEPPTYPGSPGWAAHGHGDDADVTEKRTASTGFLAPPPAGALPPTPGGGEKDKEAEHRGAGECLGDGAAYDLDLDLDLALDTAWYGYGSTHGGAAAHGLRVELELAERESSSSSAAHGASARGDMVEASTSYARWLPELVVDEEAGVRGRQDSWDAQSGPTAAAARVRPDSWDEAK